MNGTAGRTRPDDDREDWRPRPRARRAGCRRCAPSPCARRCSSEASARDAVPLLDSSDEHRAVPVEAVGEIDPKTASWRHHHGADDQEKSADAAGGRRERRSRDARRRPPGTRQRSMTKTSPTAAPSRNASLRAIDASPTSRPGRRRTPAVAAQPARREPQRRRDQRLEDREVLGLGHEDGRQRPGWRPGRRRRAGPVRDAPTSRAIAQVSGAASEPMRTIGSAEATPSAPKSARNGAWMNEASGSQWALEGIGRTASAGSSPPTSAKIQMKSTLKPWPACEARATST